MREPSRITDAYRLDPAGRASPETRGESAMSMVQIRGVTKRYGTVTALNDLHLTVAEGELLVLLGPSGCGKTTTLRCIAGLESPDEGVITLNGRMVNDAAAHKAVPPEKRNVGVVFQSYALWPHMTVAANIEYPLRNRKMTTHERQARVREVTAVVECSDLLRRYPAQLSGGQQQRVALARALAAWPQIMLFDEPLSNLDERLRGTLRAELRRLKERLAFTGIYVTHDQEEALHLGDKIAVMERGNLLQLGSPEEVFDAPATRAVATFLGGETVLDLVQQGDVWICGSTPVQLKTPLVHFRDRVTAVLRPDRILLQPLDFPPSMGLSIRGRIVQARYLGGAIDYLIDASGTLLRVLARVDSSFKPAPGTDVVASVASPLLFDEDDHLISAGQPPVRTAGKQS